MFVCVDDAKIGDKSVSKRFDNVYIIIYNCIIFIYLFSASAMNYNNI